MNLQGFTPTIVSAGKQHLYELDCSGLSYVHATKHGMKRVLVGDNSMKTTVLLRTSRKRTFRDDYSVVNARELKDATKQCKVLLARSSAEGRFKRNESEEPVELGQTGLCLESEPENTNPLEGGANELEAVESVHAGGWSDPAESEPVAATEFEARVQFDADEPMESGGCRESVQTGVCSQRNISFSIF